MNNLRLLYVLLIFISGNVLSQVPGGINYQGVALDNYLTINNKNIALRFIIREKTPTGATLYSETRQTTTDSFGVFNVVIGAPGADLQSGNIKTVPWSDTTRKFLQVEMDIKRITDPPNSFLHMGTTQLLSVPFSFFSDISDSTRIADTARSAKYADTARVSNGSGDYFFSASISPGSYPVASTDRVFSPLSMSTVNSNEGNAYNPATSAFTAPDNGWYQFDFSMFSLFNYEVINSEQSSFLEASLALSKNGTNIKFADNLYVYKNPMSSTGQGNESYEPNSISLTCRLKLVKGDQISISKTADYNNYAVQIFVDGSWIGVYGTLSSFSEFSGYKIK